MRIDQTPLSVNTSCVCVLSLSDPLFSVLHRELALLSRVVTLTELQIPEKYHVFEPFHSIQEELRSFGCSHVSAYSILSCPSRFFSHILVCVHGTCSNHAAAHLQLRLPNARML